MSGATSTSTWWRRQGRTERRSGRTSTRGSVLLINQGYLPPPELRAERARGYRRFRRRCWRGRGAPVPGAEAPAGGGALGGGGGGPCAAGAPPGGGGGGGPAPAPAA